MARLAQTGEKEGHKRSDGCYYYNHTADEIRSWLEPHFLVEEIVGTENRVPTLHHVAPPRVQVAEIV